MNKVLGVVIEYNPFHNGHLYHLKKSKEATNCEHVIGVMSGNYVQRGEPAIINKWARTEIALKNGVDIVIELPTVYAIQSAEGFALGAIHLLAHTGIVTDIVFGSETGEIDTLKKTAKELLKLEENPQLIKNQLKKGVSYTDALSALVESPEVFSGSNNILALEYIKTIYKYNLNLNIGTIKRIKNQYNNTDLPKHSTASATALRPYIASNNDDLQTSIGKYIPFSSLEIINNCLKRTQKPASINDLSEFFFGLVYRQGIYDLKELHRMEVGLENRFYNHCINNNTISAFIESVSTKRYSKSRISRLVLQFILGIDSQLIEVANEYPGAYIKILGCSSKGLSLLRDIKKHSAVPYSMSFNSLLRSSSSIGVVKPLELENKATNLYTRMFYKNSVHQLEYYQNSIIIK